jgi:hypothetical protein
MYDKVTERKYLHITYFSVLEKKDELNEIYDSRDGQCYDIVSWDIPQCSLVDIYRNFSRTCWLQFLKQKTLYPCILKMEEAQSTETAVNSYQTTLRHIQSLRTELCEPKILHYLDGFTYEVLLYKAVERNSFIRHANWVKSQDRICVLNIFQISPLYW